jgi:hypothetical protein
MLEAADEIERLRGLLRWIVEHSPSKTDGNARWVKINPEDDAAFSRLMGATVQPSGRR